MTSDVRAVIRDRIVLILHRTCDRHGLSRPRTVVELLRAVASDSEAWEEFIDDLERRTGVVSSLIPQRSDPCIDLTLLTRIVYDSK